MNANELANELERPNNWQQENNFTTQAATMLRQQQNEIEDLKSANRFIQNFAEEQHQRAVALESELDRAVELYTDKAIENEALKMGFAGNGTSDSELAEVWAQANRWFLKIKEQQAEIEELKTCLIVEQEHNERMVEDRSKYEALAHVGGVEAGKELAVMEVMSEHCTCYKLGYSQLNDYRKVNNENNNEAA